ncbi:hypothetical protein NW995_002463 [Salmonella enterica]|nr:hypothetical protein [Salmonella enterica]EJY0635033.1 hypothetical protein [Salmonella enterica subsp. enterica serovar Schwarzengrund]
MAYKYENLCDKGFVKIPVSRRKHNKMLPNRKQRFGAKIEYYYHPDTQIFEAQYFCSVWMKVLLITFMFIPAIIMQGVPETIRDIGDLIYERKRGKFSSDRWFLKHDKTTDGALECHIRNVIHH